MTKKDTFRDLVVKTVKVMFILSALFAAGVFIDMLPFAAELPFIDDRLPVSVFLNALLSLLSIAAFIKYGTEARPRVDALADRVKGSGALVSYTVTMAAILVAYYSFQGPVYPFIKDYEWAYQSFFLALTLFFMTKAGIIVYASGEDVGRFFLSLMDPYAKKEQSPGTPPHPPAQA
jgi:hypothetical protein